MESESARRSEDLDGKIQAMSTEVSEALSLVEKQIADGQSHTRSNVSDLERRLQSSMTSVQSRLREIASGLSRVAEPTVSPAPAVATVQARQPAEPAAAAERTTAPAPEAAPVDPQDLVIQKHMKDGMESFRGSRYAEAAKSFSEALTLQPENVDARLYRAASSFRASPGDSSGYAKIESDLRIVLQSRRDDALAAETLGMVYAEKGHWKEAADRLSQAAALEPQNTRILREAATCAFYAGEQEAAESYADKACTSAPNDAEVWREAGRVYESGGKHGEAARRFTRSLSLEPKNASTKLDLGRAYLAAGERQKGIETLDALIQEHPGTAAAAAAVKELKALGQ